MPTYDLVVVGGGTAGLVSAHIAAGMGARVALVERERTGGDCLWTGCVPSKSLLAAAELAQRMREADAVGLAPVEPVIDFARVMKHVRAAQARIEPEDSPERLRAAGVEVIEADARFTGERTLRAGGRELRFRRAILATGSEPVLPPVEGLAEAAPLTSDTVWRLESLPDRLLVLGGGPIGCELGQAFARLGSAVTIVERAPRLLEKEEPRAGEALLTRLQAEGVDVRLGAELEAVASGTARLAGGDTLAFDAILAATGRSPRTSGQGLNAAGVEIAASGAAVTDERLRTTNHAIYAAGDVTGRLPFTHVAAQHARIAAPNALLGLRRTLEESATPRVVYTDPEVAAVGLTLAQAREEHGDRAQVVEYDYSHSDRAITAGRAFGFARLIGDRRGRLVGATVMAHAAGETIAELAAHVATGAKIDAVSSAVHAYPTFSEGPARAADEHVRARYATPAVRRLLRPYLVIARWVAR